MDSKKVNVEEFPFKSMEEIGEMTVLDLNEYKDQLNTKFIDDVSHIQNPDEYGPLSDQATVEFEKAEKQMVFIKDILTQKSNPIGSTKNLIEPNINPIMEKNTYREVSSIRRFFERARYNVLRVTSSGFRHDVQLAKNGIGDNILNSKQIKNILTYQRAVGGVSDTSLEFKKADLERLRKLQDLDAGMVIVGKMGVLKGTKEIMIASDVNGKLHYSSNNELGIKKWRKMNVTSLENSVRAIAGEISTPLKWYSEFLDPTLLGVNIKNIEGVRSSFSKVEKEFKDTRVYNQHFENLSTLSTQTVPENLYRYVQVDRSYLQGLGLIEGNGQGKSVSLKLIGADQDMFVLSSSMDNGVAEDIIILKDDYQAHLQSKDVEKIGDLGHGVSYMRVDNNYKLQIGDHSELLTVTDFKISPRINDESRDKVLDNLSNSNYYLNKGSITIKDSMQEVTFRTHAKSGDIHFNVKHGANKRTKDVKLDKASFDAIYIRLMRPNNIHQFREISERSAFKLPVIKINQTRGIAR